MHDVGSEAAIESVIPAPSAWRRSSPARPRSFTPPAKVETRALSSALPVPSERIVQPGFLQICAQNKRRRTEVENSIAPAGDAGYGFPNAITRVGDEVGILPAPPIRRSTPPSALKDIGAFSAIDRIISQTATQTIRQPASNNSIAEIVSFTDLKSNDVDRVVHQDQILDSAARERERHSANYCVHALGVEDCVQWVIDNVCIVAIAARHMVLTAFAIECIVAAVAEERIVAKARRRAC